MLRYMALVLVLSSLSISFTHACSVPAESMDRKTEFELPGSIR